MRGTKDLQVCGSCRRPFVVAEAVVPTPADVPGLLVELRCADCGWEHTGVYPATAVEALDRAMDRADREIRAALDVCELTEELERIDQFARALHADLIVPEDF